MLVVHWSINVVPLYEQYDGTRQKGSICSCPIQFSMNNRVTIDVVQYLNYLGIMLNPDMSWKTHVAMVRNKLSRINGILHRLKYIYSQNISITLYKSFFVPLINYGSLFWGHAGGALDIF